MPVNFLPRSAAQRRSPPKTQHSTYAVVVGITDYQDKDIPDLRFADRDAEAFATFLRSPVGGSLDNDHLKVLTNENATAARVSIELDWLMEVVASRQTTPSRLTTESAQSAPQQGEVSGMIRQTTESRLTNVGVQPNPTTDRFWLDLCSFAGEAVIVSIHSDLGWLLCGWRIPAVEELKLQVSLREAGASAGIYTVNVQSAGGVVAKRVVLVE